jgi:hypothetical protein
VATTSSNGKTTTLAVYRRLLAIAYAVGALLHVADVFGLRLEFSRMPMVWKAWILFLMVGDVIAAVGLWKHRGWGVAAFLTIAFSQLFAYSFCVETFGRQSFLVGFHVVTLSVYAYLWLRHRRAAAATL